jgi:hypothetical protein
VTRAAAAPSVLAGLAVAGLLLAAQPVQEPPPAEGWSTFEGSWSAAGQRHELPTEGASSAAILSVSGAIVLASREGLGRGFRGEAIGYDDGRTTSIGCAVWTDDRGDLLFSELRGEPVHAGRRVVGTFTGGTGRYAGVSGVYELTWQQVVQAEPGVVQVVTVALKGRFRRDGAPR